MGHSGRWLCNEAIDAGTRRWAVEGLAYLTFDADVKEEFVEDKAAMQAMFQLAKVCGEACRGALGKAARGGCGCGGAGWAFLSIVGVMGCRRSRRTVACSTPSLPR